MELSVQIADKNLSFIEYAEGCLYIIISKETRKKVKRI